MKVTYPFYSVADVANNVTFHDLHVIDVEQQLYVRAIDHFAKRNAPADAVAKVAGVVNFGIKQFNVDVNALFMRVWSNALQDACAGLQALRVCLIGKSIASDCDEAVNVMFSRQVDRFTQFCFNAVMLRLAGKSISHRAVPAHARHLQAMASRHFDGLFERIVTKPNFNRVKTYLLHCPAEVIETNFLGFCDWHDDALFDLHVF